LKAPRPPLALRAAVLVAGATFALGLVAGVVAFVHHDERGRPDELRVQVRGAPPEADLRVEVDWSGQGVRVTQPAHRLDEAGAWWVAPLPVQEGTVTLRVLDGATDPPRELARRRVEVPVEGPLRVEVAPAGP
jgi:hypothetical protein